MFKLKIPSKNGFFLKFSIAGYRISDFKSDIRFQIRYPIWDRISDLGSDIRCENGYPIRLGIYQAYPVNPKDVFEEGFSDTQTSGSRLTMLF